MNIPSISNSAIFTKGQTAAEAAKAMSAEGKIIDKVDEKSSESQKTPKTDAFVKSKDSDKDSTGIYSRESLLEKLRQAEEQRAKAFQETIKSMITKQGQVSNFVFKGVKLTVTEEDRLAAEKSIQEGGEYSVDSVASRIMNMAKALSGGDDSKFSILKEAVIKGFKGAASALGKKDDEMPDITKQTFNEVMKRFDDWENSFKTSNGNSDSSDTTAN